MESYQVGGGDVESRTKTQHRGRAYQCLHWEACRRHLMQVRRPCFQDASLFV